MITEYITLANVLIITAILTCFENRFIHKVRGKYIMDYKVIMFNMLILAIYTSRYFIAQSSYDNITFVIPIIYIVSFWVKLVLATKVKSRVELILIPNVITMVLLLMYVFS